MPNLISQQELQALVRDADGYFISRDFDRARPIYARLRRHEPSTFFFFARHIETTIRSTDPEAADQILTRDNFPANDDEFFWGCQILIEARRYQRVAEWIDRERDRGVISEPILAAGRARLYASTGSLFHARTVIAPFSADIRASLPVLRLAYFLEHDLGDLDTAIALSKRTALLWGHLVDCRFAFELMTFLTDFAHARDFLDQFVSAFSVTKSEIEPLQRENLRRLQLLQATVDQFGSFDYGDRQKIKAALASSGVQPDMVLWAKHSLVLLVRSNHFSQSDFEMFGEYLPSWEEGKFKSYILFNATQRFSKWPRVQEQWLRFLIGRASYGDAAEWLVDILPNTAIDDIVFFGLMILRLSRLNVVPEFITPETEDALLVGLRTALPRTSLGLRATLFDHLDALGLDPGNWHPATAIQAGESAKDAPAFRRLLGMSTGRLARASHEEFDRFDATTKTTRTDTKIPRPIFVISGQLRGFETAWPSLYRYVVLPTGAPVLLTVWDKTTNPTGRHAHRLERALPDDIVKKLRPEQRFTDIFEKEFPRTSSLLFGETDVSVSELAAIMAKNDVAPVALETENDALLMQLLRPSIQNGMIRMYYRFARAERLVREHELRTGIAFSHVIWSRPDYEITQLPANSIQECMRHEDVAFSSWVTEISVGDYFMVLPRLAFAAICSVFSRVVVAGDVTFSPWRPKRESELSGPAWSSAFAGPETIYEVLLSSGFIPLGRVPGIAGRLLGRTPSAELIRSSFQEELAQKQGVSAGRANS